VACYWDTSALLALLFQEPGTRQVRETASRGRGLPGYTSFFTLLEMESAYARRLAEGSLTAEGLTRLRLSAQRLEAALALIWPDRDLLDQARRLVLELGLKPADALQLASALLAAGQEQAPCFASLDKRLSQAAQAAGLRLAW